jgi:outer membrane immunogenic protein
LRQYAWAAAALIASATAATAADFPRGTAPYNALATYNWMGPYIGANLGYQWSTVSTNPTRPSGVAGGVQAGYNSQSGQFVFGGETDLQLSGANDTFAPWKFSNPWFGTLRGRAGYVMNNILLYGTAGLAYGDLRVESGALSETHTQAGWTAGAGIEVGFAPQWSVKAEYLYVDLGDSAFALTGVRNGFTSNVLRFGVNYRF